MAGYIGTKAVNLSTTGADINGNANVDGTLDVTGTVTAAGATVNGDLTLSSTAPTFYLAETDTSNQHRIIATGGSLYIQAADSDGTTDGDLHLTGYTNADLNLLNIKAVTTAMNGNIAATGSVTAGDVFITGPTPVLTLTDDDTASEYTKIENSSGATYITGRNGAGNGAIILSGQGGGVTDEYARFNSSGNFGIGTAAPSYPLDIQADVQGFEVSGRIRNNDALSEFSHAQLRLETPYNNASISSYTGAGGVGYLTFDNMGAERMRIDSSGNVLVGSTASSGGKLKVEAGTGSYSTYFYKTNTADEANMILRSARSSGGTAATMIYFMNSTGGGAGSITTTGSSTAFNATSDYRLKENITPIQGAADIVKAMQPVTYNFKADSTDWHDGFLAHELQELHPRAVVGEKDGMKDEEYEVTPEVEVTYDAEGVELTPAVPAVMGTRNVPDHQGVDYSKLTPILTAALKEALNKIEVLEAQNATFETRLAALEATP